MLFTYGFTGKILVLWQTIYLGGGKYLDRKYHSQYCWKKFIV